MDLRRRRFVRGSIEPPKDALVRPPRTCDEAIAIGVTP
jgi:hypothetical protein